MRAHLEPDPDLLALLKGKRILAFAGIGDPSRFFRALRSNGLEVVRERIFADHHPYSRAEIETLLAEARRDMLTPVTTEKDLARLRVNGSVPNWADTIASFAVTLEFDDAARFRKFVAGRLFEARDKNSDTR